MKDIFTDASMYIKTPTKKIVISTYNLFQISLEPQINASIIWAYAMEK